jgi:hypothetical protein
VTAILTAFVLQLDESDELTSIILNPDYRDPIVRHQAVIPQSLTHTLSIITLTIDTYSHVMPGLEEAAARSIDDVLGDAVAGNP